MFQPNFVTFTSTDITGREPLDGQTFKGNQNDGFVFVRFADGSGGLEKEMKDWVGNKTGRLYRAEILAAQEYLAAQVGKAMNAPVRDCYFTSPTTVIMPFIFGTPGDKASETSLPQNAQGTALQLFDYLVANADRRPKNWIITSDNRIVGIDHALCNFRPRFPDPDFVAEMWNNGVSLDSLTMLRPKLAALVLDFTSLGMGDKHENLMANFDRLLNGFQVLDQVAVVIKDALTPPKGVQETAQRALAWIKDGKAGSGFTPVGRKRASDLANAHPVSLDTLKRMKAYFDRHQPDQKAEGFQQGEKGYPSPGRVAWDAWGGDAGWSWAKSVVERNVEKEAAGHEFHGNQHTGSKGSSAPPRQSDPNRNQVSADRNKVPADRNQVASASTDDQPKADAGGDTKKIWAQEQAQQILDGKMPVIPPDQLLDFFRQVKDLPKEFQEADATEINTETAGPRGPLLGDEGVGGGVSRTEMPQLNGDEQKREFIKELEEKMGVKTTEERVDPTTLSPYQKEMVAGKIGNLVSQNPTGIPDSQRIIVSSDNIVIDGHHNWAAGVALHEGLDSRPLLPIFRVNMTAAELIPLATKFGDEHGNERKGMTNKSVEVVEKNAKKAVATILHGISLHIHRHLKKQATAPVPRYEGTSYENPVPKHDEQSWGNLGEGQTMPQSHAETGDALASHAFDLWRKQQYQSAGFAHEDAASSYRRAAKITSDPHERASLESKAQAQDNEAKAAHFTHEMGEAHSPTEIYKGDVQGHPFHGNQYESGEGGWKPVMTSAEAMEWAKNSAIQVPLYHGTNRPDSIMSEGFRDNTGGGNLINGTWLNDFDPRQSENEVHWGQHTLTVMANVKSVATPEQTKAIHIKVEELIWGTQDRKINPGDEARKIALEQGFDALQPSKGVYIVLNPKNLTVVSDEVKKGEAAGHPFRGNQWTTGQDSEMPDNVAAFARNLKEFYGAGGKVERIDNPDKMHETYEQALQLQKTPEYKNGDTRHKQGIRFLAEAALEAKIAHGQTKDGLYSLTGSHLFVARDKDGQMVSAINISTFSGGLTSGYKLDGPEVPHAEIGYLGSTGTMPGAATALMEQALQLASDKGLTVTYTTTSDSQPYHDMLGVQELNYRGLRGFSPESAAEVAALPNPKPTIIKSFLNLFITKGDVAGHAFHGNQYEQVASSGKTTSPRKPRAKTPTIAGLPKGWKLKSKDGSRVVLTSKNGNTAIFATRSRGWKPTEKYSQMVLATCEKFTSGKTINFVAEANVGSNSLAYVNRAKPDIIGMGRYSSVLQTLDHQRSEFEKQVTNNALVGTDLSLALMGMAKGSPEREALIDKMGAIYDSQPRTEAMVQGISHSYASYVTPEKIIETMFNHELGHSDFFGEGHKISEIYPALTEAAKATLDASRQAGGSRPVSLASFTAPEIWAQTQLQAAQDLATNTSSRYSGFDVGNGVIVPRGDYVDYEMKQQTGSLVLRSTPQSILQSIGVTQYGSTKLQETVAEARAFYSSPELPKSALTNRIAEILGWNKTAKSVSIPFVKSEDDSVPPSSDNVYQDANGNTIARIFDVVDTSGNGAITIVGEQVILSDGSVVSLNDYNATH